MSRPSRATVVPTAAALALAFLLTACAAADPGWPPQNTNFDLTPVPVSADVAVGSNRMLFNILDRQNKSIAAADRTVHLDFFHLATSRTQPAIGRGATFMETVPGRPGLYRAEVPFDRAGEWGVHVVATDPGGATRTGRVVFQVRETGTTPQIGGPAPASDTPTADTPDEIDGISTDDDPDPDFYRSSVADALEAQQPFALVFATPAFCTSATCAPTLDLVKTVAADYKSQIEFIHVEPYELEQVEGRLRPVLSDQNLPIPVPAATEWGLPTEPYIFVVGGDGKVIAKFEGIAAADELRDAFTRAAS